MGAESLKLKRQKSDAEEPEIADDTRARLVQAAREIFAEAGYHGATVRQICTRARANVALVNYHFGDKLGLYTEVLQQLLPQTIEVKALHDALDQNMPPEDILRALIRTRLRSICGRDLKDWRFQIMVHELTRPTPALAKIINEVSRPMYQRLCELVGRISGLPSGDEKTHLCAHSVMGQIIFYLLEGPLLVRLWPGLKMTPEQVDRIADHIADFSLPYLRELGTKRTQAVSVRYRSTRK
jgi:AcrR family transcriptional regulator